MLIAPNVHLVKAALLVKMAISQTKDSAKIAIAHVQSVQVKNIVLLVLIATFQIQQIYVNNVNPTALNAKIHKLVRNANQDIFWIPYLENAQNVLTIARHAQVLLNVQLVYKDIYYQVNLLVLNVQNFVLHVMKIQFAHLASMVTSQIKIHVKNVYKIAHNVMILNLALSA
ncbi:hypothetical protein TTHERM_000096737 (macronuclear) [Tetrahymena thermophila SB210]|uniref:Uncharacterized protein n=1 Tax=Tetrahymena thermophila (strain SB210) TaxID=312017 RepID=W7XKZ0_TETTS|nr:hypothetical protein TTHERM_000096737 [Tetrahymena thermophila SB210]EWS75374.1 hypothetical protein TTHERM_000096737 [Tetrahymena thermophila SB210]|eukprot:XP_012652048.1 hypothetical protein TTHERM_000096737 [Tetrahymena thermophila SB210]